MLKKLRGLWADGLRKSLGSLWNDTAKHLIAMIRRARLLTLGTNLGYLFDWLLWAPRYGLQEVFFSKESLLKSVVAFVEFFVQHAVLVTFNQVVFPRSSDWLRRVILRLAKPIFLRQICLLNIFACMSLQEEDVKVHQVSELLNLILEELATGAEEVLLHLVDHLHAKREALSSGGNLDWELPLVQQTFTCISINWEPWTQAEEQLGMIKYRVLKSKVLKHKLFFPSTAHVQLIHFGINQTEVQLILLAHVKCCLPRNHEVKWVNVVAFLVYSLTFTDRERSKVATNPCEEWLVTELRKKGKCAESSLVDLHSDCHFQVQGQRFNKIL